MESWFTELLALEVCLALREYSYLNENGREQQHFISKGIPLSFHRQDSQSAWLPCRSALSAHYWPYALIPLTSFSWGHQHHLLMNVKKRLFLYWR